MKRGVIAVFIAILCAETIKDTTVYDDGDVHNISSQIHDVDVYDFNKFI